MNPISRLAIEHALEYRRRDLKRKEDDAASLQSRFIGVTVEIANLKLEIQQLEADLK